MNNSDTICAIATGQGGAIGIIRISGDDAISIADKIFTTSGNRHKPLKERDANTVTFGQIKDKSGNVIDEVLVSIFHAPHSYTGEDSVEISCHGSTYILQKVMQLLIGNGCRSAGPGEFTRRAFINGKMDLSQAEAVADLIASSSEASHRIAISQMRGNFSLSLSQLRKKLLKLTSLMELELDFSDHEELEFADRSELAATASDIEHTISRLIKSFSLGNVMKNGVPVAIVGETNSGKSTLLNALVGEERAIVSDIHGTTRDVIEDTVNINGIVFRFIDTAGIRDTQDQIETLGIERTFKKISQASVVLWLIDATRALTQLHELSKKITPLCKDKQLIIVFNKTDLIDKTITAFSKETIINIISEQIRANANNTNAKDKITISGIGTKERVTTTAVVKGGKIINPQKHNAVMEDKVKEFDEAPTPFKFLAVSAKQKTNIQALREMLVECVNLHNEENDGIIVSNLRHYEALNMALDAIHRVQEGLSTKLSTDLVAQDLHNALYALAEITGGEITSSETLENIFKNFCIGK